MTTPTITLPLNSLCAIPYDVVSQEQSGTVALNAVRARIASGDITFDPSITDSEKSIIAFDNVEAYVPTLPRDAVVVYVALKGDTQNALIDHKNSALSRLAAVDEQIAALS